ncbi:MAG TPA: hypothetical protein VLT58_01885, partial [Polyangia bacterium]|nr:hypothetical protein [Polyangia bacterium]
MNQTAALSYPVLQAAGIQAGHIAHLWWVFLAVLSAVYLAVVLALLVAIVRRRRAAVQGEGEQGAVRVVAVSVGLTVLILLGLFGGSVATGRALGTLGEAAGEPLSIKVIGHQWWWELQYQNHDVSQMVTTANEL